jgi:hypothetical protein
MGVGEHAVIDAVAPLNTLLKSRLLKECIAEQRL